VASRIVSIVKTPVHRGKHEEERAGLVRVFEVPQSYIFSRGDRQEGI